MAAGRGKGWRGAVLRVAFAALAVAGCHAPIVEGDPATVQEAADTLQQSNIPYQTEALADGRRRLEVLVDDVPRAHEALGAPRPRELPPAEGGLLGRIEDRERSDVRARERSLEQLLEALPEVARATVRLALPRSTDALAGQTMPAKASVLLEGRKAVDEALVRALLTHAEPILAADAIVIVQRVRPPPSSELVAVGPFAVAPGSARQVRGLIVFLSGTLVVVVGGILVWYLRYLAQIYLPRRRDVRAPAPPSSEENLR